MSDLRARLVAIAACAAAACADPVHDDAVAVLGPEVAGVVPGPSHRAGQPCTTCHGDEGPSEVSLAVAGTLYAVRDQSTPLPSAAVVVTDARGESRRLTSNEVGNFFITSSEWTPQFPLRVTIEADELRREMTTSIGRDGGCATCHREGGDASFMPRVFLRNK